MRIECHLDGFTGYSPAVKRQKTNSSGIVKYQNQLDRLPVDAFSQIVRKIEGFQLAIWTYQTYCIGSTATKGQSIEKHPEIMQAFWQTFITSTPIKADDTEQAYVKVCEVSAFFFGYKISPDEEEFIDSVWIVNDIHQKKILEELTSMDHRLREACDKGYEKVVKALLEAGANIEAKDEDDQTSLHHAANGGHPEAAKLLLEAGAKTEVHTKGSDTGLILDNQGRTPLHLAAEQNNAEVVQILLAAEADVNALSTIEQNPLHRIAVCCDGDGGKVVQILVEAGANIEAKDSMGYTPLILAAGGGLGEIKALLEAGADKDAVTINGYTPLHIAAHQGRVEVVKVLLAAGSDKDAKDYRGKTPFDFATERNSTHIVEILSSWSKEGVYQPTIDQGSFNNSKGFRGSQAEGG